MAWDVFVMRVPDGTRSIRDLPEAWAPAPLASLDDVKAWLRERARELEFTSSCSATLRHRDGWIDVELLCEGDAVSYVAMHVRGGAAVVDVVWDLARSLGASAFSSAGIVWETIEDARREFAEYAAWSSGVGVSGSLELDADPS